MTNYKSCLLIILLAFAIEAYPQMSTLLEEGVEKTVEVKISNKTNQNIYNQMVKLVAKSKSLTPDQTKITYKVKEHRKITKSNGKLELSIAIGNLTNTEEIKYLNFPINQFLTPGLISYKYVWEDKDGNILETQKNENESFKNGAQILKKSIPDAYQEASYKLYLSELEFGFTAPDVKKLDEFLGTIDGYYNADAQLNMMEQEMLLIKVDSLEILENNYQKTLDNIKAINQIRSQRFPSKLDLASSDPIQLMSHLGRAEEQNKSLKKELEYNKNNMHIAYYRKGLDWQKWNNQATAISYFNKSIQIKNTFAPPYVELAQYNFDEKQYSKAIDTCKKVLLNFKPDTDTRYKAVKLSESVIYVYIDSIKALIQKKEYSNAVALLEKCKQYGKEIPGIRTFTEFEEMQGLLYESYYNEMAEKTNILIESGELLAAHNNVDSMARFREINARYITESQKETNLLKKLYDAWVLKGKTLLDSNQVDSSIVALQKASELCHRYPVISCTEDLNQLLIEAYQNLYNQLIEKTGTAIEEKLPDSALHLLKDAALLNQQHQVPKNAIADTLYQAAMQLKYHDLILAGDQTFQQNKMREAMAFYKEAIAIEKETANIPNPDLPNKIKATAVNMVLILCLQSESFIEVLNMQEAQEKYIQAKNMAAQYDITSHEEVSEALASLAAKLDQGKCNQSIYDYEIQISVTKKFIDRREFILAWQALEKATEISYSNKDCIFDKNEHASLSNEIRTIVHYQKEMHEISELLNNKEYSDAVDSYIKLTTFYTDSCKNNFGIKHKTLEQFFNSHSNNMFIDFGVHYYSELGNTEFAYSLLKDLRQKNYIAEWSKGSQEALGTKLALTDYELNPELNPKIKVLDYTHSDKWFNYLKKAYLNAWKVR